MSHLQLNIALASGLSAALAICPAPARAQDSEPVAMPSAEKELEPLVETEPAPPAPPPSRTLDDLIPLGAVADPEEWAAQGVTNPAVPTLDPEAVERLAQEAIETSTDPLDSKIAGMLDDFDLPEPERLEPDPEVTALAEIDAPDLVELPPLEEFRVSEDVVLAFPADEDRFPERTDFIERFRALSTVEALGKGGETLPQIAARARADQELLAELLRVYGYYGGDVIRQLSGGRRGDENGGAPRGDADPQVRFDILPGPLYRFGSIDLGALDAAPDYAALRAAFEIQPGDPLYADRIVAEELDLRLALGETGYPFAKIAPPELLVDHERVEGDLTLPVSPGGKYVFGGIASSDARFLSERHLARIARFDMGDVYQTSLQVDLGRAVIATGLVSSVIVTPREITPPANGEPGEVALDVEFERAKLRTIAGAIGYGTEEGFKVEASWEHRNLFPPEGALKLRGILGTKEQLASISFKRNNFRARDQILTLDAYVSDLETQAVDARTAAVRGSFERVSNLLFQKPLSWQIGAEALYTSERPVSVDGTNRPRQPYTIVGLFGGATLDGSDDLLDPSSGFRLTGFVAPEISRSLGTETFYLRTQGDGSYYLPFGEHVLAGRIRVASIIGADASQVAPSRRLYAGGGGSVRGYGYQAIGPRNSLGEALGGASAVELSIEARIQTGFLDGAVEIVPFVDAGSVSRSATPDLDTIQFGAGIGVRYKTSFGPIRVDIGTPINPTEFDSPVVVYVGLGQAF